MANLVLNIQSFELIEIEALVEAYRQGAKVYELAKEFGIHRETAGLGLACQGAADGHSKATT